MSATFKELSDRIGHVGDLYARVHAIERSADDAGQRCARFHGDR
jgi:hypothetical protein